MGAFKEREVLKCGISVRLIEAQKGKCVLSEICRSEKVTVTYCVAGSHHKLLCSLHTLHKAAHESDFSPPMLSPRFSKCESQVCFYFYSQRHCWKSNYIIFFYYPWTKDQSPYEEQQRPAPSGQPLTNHPSNIILSASSPGSSSTAILCSLGLNVFFFPPPQVFLIFLSSFFKYFKCQILKGAFVIPQAISSRCSDSHHCVYVFVAFPITCIHSCISCVLNI